MENNPVCLLCSEHEFQERTQLCKVHSKCSVCSGILTPQEIRATVDSSTFEGVETEDLKLEKICHVICFARGKNPTQPTDSRELHMLNLARLIFFPDMSLSIETNQQNVSYAADRFIHDCSFEEVYMQRACMEKIIAFLSIKLAKKDRKKVEVEVEQIKKKLQAEKAAKEPASNIPVQKKDPDGPKFGIPLREWNQMTTTKQSQMKLRYKIAQNLMKQFGFDETTAIAEADKLRRSI